MKKFFFLIIGIVSFHNGFSQISVYDCNAINSTVTQAEIDAVSEFYQPCVEFNNGSYLFIGNSNHTVRASNDISLQPGFHSGSYTPNGQMHLMIEPKSEIDIVKIGPGDLSNVLRYKKLELGIALPADLQVKIDRFINNTFGEKINPFIENHLDVEIEFMHVSSGTIKIVDGFYYRDFERNDLNNDWDPKHTGYPFRVRFAPPQNGKWTAKLKIKRFGYVLFEANEFVFKVVESGDPGYVKVHQNKKNLQRGNRMIFPVGHNFPYPDEGVIKYHDLTSDEVHWPPSMMHKTAPLSAWKSYLTDIENYAELGGGFIRIVQAPWSSLIEFEEKGNYYKRLHYAWEQDKLFDLCEEKDVLVLFDMMIHEPLMLFGDYHLYDWDWDYWNSDGSYDANSLYPKYCYNDDSTHTKKPHDMFLDNDESHLYSDLYYHEQRTRYYISRYGYSTKIYEFELLSEPFHLNEFWIEGNNHIQPLVNPSHADYNEVRTAYFNYNKRISKYIQNHAEQLVGINFSAPAWNAATSNIYDPSASLSTVDVLGVNYYSAIPNKLLIQKNSQSDNNEIATGENSFFARIDEYHDEFNKPVILPEAGHSDDFASCANYTGHYVDIMSLGFTGIAGFHSWDGYDHHAANGLFDLQMLWPSTIRAQQHMNGDDVINTLSNGDGSWVQGREYTPDLKREHQYYLSNDQNRGVGFVKNRTFNVKSEAILNGNFNSPCVSNSLNINPNLIPGQSLGSGSGGYILDIEGLQKHKWYQIDFYSYKQGSYLYSNCDKTNKNGDLLLLHPILFYPLPLNGFEEINPICWYVVNISDCNKDDKQFTYELLNSESKTEFKLYPNPVIDRLVIESNSVLGEIIVSDIFGKELIRINTNKNNEIIDLSAFEKGVYLVNFTSLNKLFSIIKE